MNEQSFKKLLALANTRSAREVHKRIYNEDFEPMPTTELEYFSHGERRDGLNYLGYLINNPDTSQVLKNFLTAFHLDVRRVL